MSFPPPLPNNQMFQAFAQAGVPPMQRFQIPMGGLSVPIMPTGAMSMGVTVPAGVASISAPPIRHQNSAIIAAPPIMSIPGQPQLLYPPHMNPIIPQKLHQNDASKRSFSITVFVGNITDRASDMLIRQLLSKCGSVNNWKRVQGPNGKLQAFGFCEYSDPESAMRAIRLLHEFEIVDKKLIVRVDAKTQEKLDDYRKLKYPNEGDKNGEEKGSTDSTQKPQDIVDEATLEEDKIVKNQFLSVLKEHEIELAKEIEPKVHKNRHHSVPKDKQEDINDIEMEDDKRNLIHREIDKFRDTYKKYDEEKEEEKRKKEDSRNKRDRKNYSRRSRSRERDDRGRSRRSRDRDRRSNRDRRSSSIEDDLERQRSESPLDEEELLLRRRQEKLVREKEHSYQRRLKDWEAREKRKAKDFDRECSKESRRKEEEEIEKQKLKQFLQDYEDDKHDSKYYKGRILDRRLADRQREIEQDEFEREQERKELEELRKKLSDEGHPDPESEVLKRLDVKTGCPSDITDRIKVLMSEARNNIAFLNDQDSSGSASNPNPANGTLVKTFGFAGMKISTTGAATTSSSTTENVSLVPNGASSLVTTADVTNENSNSSIQILNDAKRKRLMMSDIFNSTEDDEANAQNAKKRRLPPNALLEDSNTDSNLSTGSNKQSTSQISQEEKRRQIKTLIDKIPTSKNELFIYKIEWDLLDNNLMERRIRPWINKKISDYIGEEEQTLLDFICKKLLSQTSAQSLLDDVAMVLDDEAQVFVVKLWRLLIYEIEAKKLGLNK